MIHNKKIEKPKLIIGEGKEDFLFFDSLIKYLEIDDIQVDFYGGKTNLNNYFQTLHLQPCFSNLCSLGITRDADQSFDTASQSIDNTIRQNKLNEKGNLTIKKFIGN
ncbi:MAG: hypothetical protein O4860_08600 [Trichodesmium sp. St2_bin2_1]|nr:hypothetical protein [Trichodesmium sp. St2_bin2_1]